MNNELKHYGVKGMKWGVRKQRPTSGKSRTQARRHAKLNSYTEKYKKSGQDRDRPVVDIKTDRYGNVKLNRDGSPKVSRVSTLGRDRRNAALAAAGAVSMAAVWRATI